MISVARDIAHYPERPTNLSVVEACSLLNALTPAEREELAAGSYMAYADRGELVFLHGSPAEFVGVVGSGFVKMSKATHGGQEVALELLGPGQVFGLLAVIEGRSFPLNATAVTNCWYLKIPQRTMMKAYEASSPLKDTVIRSVGPRLRKAHEMMLRLSSGRVEERIAVVLFILADSYGTSTAEGMQITVPLTRQDVAEMAGTTVETAIRVLSRWQKEGLVCTDRHVITLRNEAALREMFEVGA